MYNDGMLKESNSLQKGGNFLQVPGFYFKHFCKLKIFRSRVCSKLTRNKCVSVLLQMRI